MAARLRGRGASEPPRESGAILSQGGANMGDPGQRFPIDILMTAPMPTLSDGSFEQRFVVHRPWEAADQGALLAQAASRIRGIAAGGLAKTDGILLDALPALENVANFGGGYDRVDVASAARKGVIVTNTPDVLTDEVADLAIGLLIATVRR